MAIDLGGKFKKKVFRRTSCRRQSSDRGDISYHPHSSTSFDITDGRNVKC